VPARIRKAKTKKRLSANPGRTAENLLLLAEQHYVLEQYDQTRQLLDEVLLLNAPPKIRLRAVLFLASINFFKEDWEAAFGHAQAVLASEPENLEALKLRQSCWQSLSYASEDVADCRLILKLQPSARTHSVLLFKLNFLTETTPESLYAESRRWAELYADPLAAEIVPHRNTPDPGRRLKIGYVSPDLKNHPIMRLLPGVFEKYDDKLFEIFVYSIGQKPDSATEYLRRTVKNLVSLASNGREIAARVRADGIDILVDLAGHTMPGDALLAFALKPAPVQVSWMGVHATTGLRTMDYFLGDAHMPCPGTEHLFTEKIFRLKHTQYCYRPIGNFGDPAPAGSPYFSNGYITFGCFNKPRKITRAVAKVWSLILHLNPDSKLLLKFGGLSLHMVQRRLREWFLEDGISGQRLVFEDSSPPAEYMNGWNRVDIALDPFPYNGGTTTLDALWMGVPVVSVSGRLAVNCCGASFLSAIGFPLASSFEEYVSLASQLVKAIPITPNMRQRVREAMLRSPLMDELGLLRALQNAYREMWCIWCAAQTEVSN
jgi:protein O-GlcNAc transferase